MLVDDWYILNNIRYLYVPVPCAAHCFTFISIAWYRHAQNGENFVLFRSDLAGYVVKQNLSTYRKSLATSFHIAEEADPITVPGTICFV